MNQLSHCLNVDNIILILSVDRAIYCSSLPECLNLYSASIHPSFSIPDCLVWLL